MNAVAAAASATDSVVYSWPAANDKRLGVVENGGERLLGGR